MTLDRASPLQRRFTFWLPLLAFIVITLFPFYWMLMASLKPNNELYNLRIFPFWVFNPTLDQYKYLFTNTMYARWLANTLFVAAASTAISLVFGILAGYALARLRFFGAGVLGVAIFVSYLVPQTLLFIPMFDVIKTLNIGDTYWALILTYPTFLIPFCTALLMGYFKSIPRELEESALDRWIEQSYGRWWRSCCRWRCRASSRRGYSPSRSPGTSSSTRWSSSPRRR